jgi:ribosomal protein S18 acetylase RimI-like enzyme
VSRVRVRPARPDEAALIREIEDSAAEAFRGTTHAYVTDHPSPPPEVYEAFAARGDLLVAEQDGEPVGFAACEAFADALHIWELDVRRDQQGHGVGRALMAAVVKAARRRRLPAVTLTTFHDIAWNAPWYARLGFVELGVGTLGERLREELAQEDARGLTARCAMRLTLTP